MAAASTVLEAFRSYAGLIESALAAGALTFAPESETATDVQVERAVAYANALVDPKRPNASIDLLLQAGDRPDPSHLASFIVIDRVGHHRPHYRGLLFYGAFQAFQLTYETLGAGAFGKWEEGLRPWADMLESQLTSLPLPYSGEGGGEGQNVGNSDASRSIPAAHGAVAADAAWMALALHVAGKLYVRDAWADLASDTFGKLARAQQPGGAFLTASAGDNPETHWYHELVLLHAAGSYAVQTENRPLSAAVARNAEYHLQQTQPDHATNQPWALFPFVWNPSTRPLADGLLHAATALGGATTSPPSVLTSILLADALYCLRLFHR